MKYSNQHAPPRFAVAGFWGANYGRNQMAIKYKTVVFLQSPSDGPAKDFLNFDYEGSNEKLVEYLLGYETEDGSETDNNPVGSDDEDFTVTYKDRILNVSYSYGFRYIALTELVEVDDE
jgi:hypothetical protein